MVACLVMACLLWSDTRAPPMFVCPSVLLRLGWLQTAHKTTTVSSNGIEYDIWCRCCSNCWRHQRFVALEMQSIKVDDYKVKKVSKGQK